VSVVHHFIFNGKIFPLEYGEAQIAKWRQWIKAGPSLRSERDFS